MAHTAFGPRIQWKGREVRFFHTSFLYPLALVESGGTVRVARLAVEGATLREAPRVVGSMAQGWWPVHLNGSVQGVASLGRWIEAGQRARRTFARWVHRRLEPLPPLDQLWLRALFLGEMSELPLEVKVPFKKLGIFHLIVISGFHISFLGALLGGLLAVFLRGAYVMLWLNSSRYQRWMRWGKWGVVGIVGLFCFCIGFAPPVQRAFFSYSYRQYVTESFASPPLGTFLARVAATQAFFFPASFLSTSNMMSWLAYTSVLVACKTQATLGARLRGALWMQLGPLLFSSIFFQSLCFLSFVANWIFVPMFSGVFVAGFFLLLLPPRGAGFQMAWWIQHAYLEFVTHFAGLISAYPFLYMDLAASGAWIHRGLFGGCALFFVFLWRQIRRVSVPIEYNGGNYIEEGQHGNSVGREIGLGGRRCPFDSDADARNLCPTGHSGIGASEQRT